MDRQLLLDLRQAFPELSVEIFDDEIPYLRGEIPRSSKAVLQWLLDHQVTKVNLDQPCRKNIFRKLFSFEEVWHSTDWIPFFKTWILSQHQTGNTYQTKIIKINNLRWMFEKKDLKILLKVFPQLTKLQFVGAEVGRDDDHLFEKRIYPDVPMLSTQEVVKILGDRADPFSLFPG